MATSSLDTFKKLIDDYRQPPFNTGAVPLKEGSSSLFFTTSTSESAAKIDFGHPVTNSQLEALAKACQPATFGRHQQDVLDESYRKAGKLDAADFATQVTPSDLGIVKPIYDHLLQGRTSASARPIRVEMYKLNVYGPGAFFKAHVDTPRSEKMFASLVVVLPTLHEGGSLIFRRNGSEWTFNSAKEVQLQPPQAAFAMFFSDVEHEVAPVTSGYRVTLTYNVYFEDATTQPAAVVDSVTAPDGALKQALRETLADPEFLSMGGRLGFGLSHKYPFNTNSGSAQQVLPWLKGPDVGIKQLCEELSLKICIKAVYEEDGQVCLLNDFYDFPDEQIEDNLVDFLVREARIGEEVQATTSGGALAEDDDEGDSHGDVVPIVWAKPLKSTNKFKSQYIAYGNEATVAYAYGEVCLVANVPPFKERGGLEDDAAIPKPSQAAIPRDRIEKILQGLTKALLKVYTDQHNIEVVASKNQVSKPDYISAILENSNCYTSTGFAMLEKLQADAKASKSSGKKGL